jgi:hypothetical protein
MTDQPDGDPGSHEVRHAPGVLVEKAEVEATLAAHRDWVAAGRPGAVSHEVAMAELLADQ